MKPKILKALVTKISGETEGLLSGAIGSTDAVDRYGESVDQESWQLDNYKKNPVILWAHNLSFGEDRPPIGRAVKVEVVKGKGLVFDIQFDMADPFAADIFRKFKEKFLNAFSVGFISHKVERSDEPGTPPVLKDNELLELSAVPVPANPEALQALRARSFASKSWDSLLKTAEKDDAQHEAAITKDLKNKPTATPDAAELDQKIVSLVNKTVTDVLAKKGDGSSALHTDEPTKTPLGANPKMVAVLREATKQLQTVLAEVNKASKVAR